MKRRRVFNQGGPQSAARRLAVGRGQRAEGCPGKSLVAIVPDFLCTCKRREKEKAKSGPGRCVCSRDLRSDLLSEGLAGERQTCQAWMETYQFIQLFHDRP